ncbi:MAG: SusC/RagA family TonB-linked outer membrane protein [Bacteroidales bacterium]
MRKLTIFLAFLLFAGFQVAAQVQITGTITGLEDGLSIPGVSVVVKDNPTIGTTTDIDGKYSITVPSSAQTLVFTFVGMKAQEVLINNRTTINVQLENESVEMDEVVVVAYGTVKREAKTGSVSEFKNEALANAPVTSVDKMLSGKLAGVQITSSSGQPGASSQIRVRGTSSINAGNEPLWVIDGIPVMEGDQSYFTNSGNAMASMNPSDIESITVLKDAAAASIYGSRAANGVILVTTKKGKAGIANFQVSGKFGYSTLANDNDFGVMNGQQLLAYQRDAIYNSGNDPDDPNGKYYRPMTLLEGTQTNWMDFFTRMGKMQEYQLSAAGGNDKGTYYTSLAYHKNEGVFYGIDFEKFTVRVNADYKLTDKLSSGARFNLAYTESNDVAMQDLYYVNPAFAGMTIQPWTRPYNDDGTYNLNIPENSNTNPRATAAFDDQWEKQYRALGAYFLAWSPIKQIEAKTNNAVEATFGEGRRYWSPEAELGGELGTLQASTSQYVQLTTSNTITYNDVFAEDHFVRVLVGQEAMRRTYNSYYIYSPDVDPQIPYPNTSTAEADQGDYSYNTRTMQSYFGILDYNFRGKYYLQASVREDGSSLFGEENQWGTFWSVGASWNIHQEGFMENISILDILKLRLSYGVNGNNNISAYQAYGVYSSTAYNGGTGMLPGSPSNPLLSWELNKTWNAGIDFGFYKGRLNGTIDVYNRKTEDMLLDKQVPQTSGFSSNFMNIGSIQNNGVELQLSGEIVKTNSLKWIVGFNLAYNKSEVLDLADVEEMTYAGNDRLRYVVGKQLLTFYVKDYYGVNPSNGEALWRTEDGTITNNYNQAAWVYAGSPEPKYTGGFNTALNWKGFDLSVYLEYKQGNNVLIGENTYISADGSQMSMNQKLSALNYWKEPGDVGVEPKPIAGNTTTSNASRSTRFIEDGSYCRIKDITLSYLLPAKYSKMVKLSHLKIYVSAYNLYTFHDVDFWDPERGVDGTGYGVYPMTKTFVAGIELSF